MSVNYKQAKNALNITGKRYDLCFSAMLSSACLGFYVCSSLFICGLGFLDRNLRKMNCKENSVKMNF